MSASEINPHKDELTGNTILLCENDPIYPIEIEHKAEELFNGEILEQKYNYIDYHFEQTGIYMRARAYLDEINEVSIYGPFASRSSLEPVAHNDLKTNVTAYLKRRFSKIEELAERDGYAVVWQRSSELDVDFDSCEEVIQSFN